MYQCPLIPLCCRPLLSPKMIKTHTSTLLTLVLYYHENTLRFILTYFMSSFLFYCPSLMFHHIRENRGYSFFFLLTFFGVCVIESVPSQQKLVTWQILSTGGPGNTLNPLVHAFPRCHLWKICWRGTISASNVYQSTVWNSSQHKHNLIVFQLHLLKVREF